MSEKLLGKSCKGKLFVISAPAGTGKTTLVRMLLQEFSCVRQVLSYTTRKPRKEEKEGSDYFFISQEEFFQMREKKEFLEWVNIFGNYYGSSKKFIEKQEQKGHHLIMVIDTQGALQIKEKREAVFIFLHPPSVKELQRRLEDRGAQTEEELKERLKKAEKERKMASHYDYQIVNDKLSVTYEILRAILIAEEHKT